MALPPDSKPAPNSKAAALKAAQEDVFVREVDDALRQDRLENFVKGKGIVVLGAGIVVVLAALGGWLYWNHHQANQLAERAEQFVQALDSVNSGNLDGAKDKLKPLAEGKASASALNAQLMLAAIAQEKDDAAGAAKIYDKVAADTTAPQPMRDLATVRSVAVQFDTMKPQDVVDRLKPLTQPGNAWFGVAAEMAGMAYIKLNKPDQAGPLFAAVAKDEKSPEGLRSRARQLAAVLGVDAVADVVDAQGEPIGGDSSKDDAKSGKAAE